MWKMTLRYHGHWHWQEGQFEHVYLTNGKREIYHGNVLKFDDKTTNLQIKYKGYKKNSNNNILEMYNDFINGDLTICEQKRS